MIKHDFEKHCNALLSLDTFTIQDEIKNHFIQLEFGSAVNFANIRLKKLKKEDENYQVFKEILKTRGELLKKLPEKSPISLDELSEMLIYLVEKNPNRFKEEDFFLIKATEKFFFFLRHYHKGIAKRQLQEDKRMRFSIGSHPSCKNVPFKKTYRNFMYSLLKIEKVLEDLNNYSIWKEPISGLVINRDRIRYKRIIEEFKNNNLKRVKEVRNVWNKEFQTKKLKK